MCSLMFKLPQEVIQDIPIYKRELESFLRGEETAQKFRPFRVARGIYGQRKELLFMIRVRVPAGDITIAQLKTIAEVSLKYGSGTVHLTTRQDIQIHGVEIKNTANVMEILAKNGLSPRGGGGNTIRNITACPLAGICKDEIFAVSNYATGLTEHLLKDAANYNLPRKFKISFSGCGLDCALATVADLGFIAKQSETSSGLIRGFKVYAGGGLGAKSSVGIALEDFIPEEKAIYVAEAVKNVYNKYGDRKDRHHNRLRFLVKNLGFDKFKEFYQKELELFCQGPKLNLRTEIEKINPLGAESRNSLNLDDPESAVWFNTNVFGQKERGFYYCFIRISVGNIKADTLIKFAEALDNFKEVLISTTQHQNILIKQLRLRDLHKLYSILKDLGLNKIRAGKCEDVICCPGATTCNLGICNSPALSKEITRILEESGLNLEELAGINIKVSGCPNSCGQHSTSAIGLFGASRKINNRLAPFYNVLLGGRVGEDRTVLGQNFGLVPAKNIPIMLCEILRLYLAKRKKFEDFYAYLERSGLQDLKGLIKNYESIPSYEEDKDFYIDWGRLEEFSLAGIGPGECGAGVLDMIEADLKEAQENLNAGRLYKALICAARSLLVVKGIEPKGDLDTLKLFKDNFVKTNIVSDSFDDITEKAWQLEKSDLDKDSVAGFYNYVDTLFSEVQDAYKNMDSAFQFKTKIPAVKTGSKASVEAKGKRKQVVLDLRGVKCPLNYVQAKLKLEEMQKDEQLLLYLDEGEPISNVPVSLSGDGQEILETKKEENYYRVLVKKRV